MLKKEDEILIKKIEELNEEYLISKEYTLGSFIKYIFNLIRKRKFFNVFQLYIIHLKNIKNKKNIEYIKKENKVHIIENDNPYKVVIYTCITGEYDEIEIPLISESGCNYVLYTNNKKIKSDFWEIRQIPINLNNMNNFEINRYIKMHPSELFEDYDYSIYIDGNVKIVSVISKLTNKINHKTGLAIHRHCARNCIYEEIKVCKAYNKGKYSNLKKQAKRYKKEGFPEKYGMLECNMLIADLKNINSTKIFNNWWNEYLNSESMRDQIALPYVLWKSNFKINDIGNLGNNIYTNYLLKIKSHK